MEINRLLLLTLNFNAIYLLAEGGYTAPACHASLRYHANFMSPCDAIRSSGEIRRGDHCPGYPRVELKCASTHCGGLGLFWYKKADSTYKRLTRNECCESVLHECTNTCIDAECTNTSLGGALCTMNRCNGCRAEWFLVDQVVTEQCGGNDPDKTTVYDETLIDRNAHYAQFESVLK